MLFAAVGIASDGLGPVIDRTDRGKRELAVATLARSRSGVILEELSGLEQPQARARIRRT